MRTVIKKLKEIYKKYYYISPLDLADSAESSRVIFFYVGSFFTSAAVLTFLFMMLKKMSFAENGVLYGFYGICTVFTFSSLVCSVLVKNVDRKKAYIYKKIPVFIMFVAGMICTVYMFYLYSAFVGIIILFFSITVYISTYYMSVPLLFILVSETCILGPGIYNQFDLVGLISFVCMMLLLIGYSFFKRYKEKQFLDSIKKQKKSLVAKTFGNFTLLYDRKVIKFTRSKSTELIAYLIYKNGSSVQTKELLSVLYGDYADSARYGANLRLLISDVKHTLSEIGIQNFFVAEYNNFRINPEVVQCDYYDFLAGEQKATKAFAGEFMNQYSWAEDTVAFLERKVLA